MNWLGTGYADYRKLNSQPPCFSMHSDRTTERQRQIVLSRLQRESPQKSLHRFPAFESYLKCEYLAIAFATVRNLNKIIHTGYQKALVTEVWA